MYLLVSSCKSNKATSVKVASSKESSKKEFVQLSKKLNLEIDKKDNLKLYQFVADWLATPHKIGGCNKSGIDCSCFVRLAYSQLYAKNIPRNSAEMYKQTKPVHIRQLQEGDLVFFNIKSNQVSHVGIYLKDNWFAHVSTTKGVMINSLSENYYQHYFTGATRP